MTDELIDTKKRRQQTMYMCHTEYRTLAKKLGKMKTVRNGMVQQKVCKNRKNVYNTEQYV